MCVGYYNMQHVASWAMSMGHYNIQHTTNKDKLYSIEKCLNSVLVYIKE